MKAPFSFRYQPVLGTELHVLVGGEAAAVAERVQARVLAEVLRLEALLSTYRPETPLSRWMRAELEDALPTEIIDVLSLAQDWFLASHGAFNPGLGRLRLRWRTAGQEARLPTRSECGRLAAEADQLPFSVHPDGHGRRVQRTGDCGALDLDALAKGWIVDRAAEIGFEPGVEWLMVNIGGDLRLAGAGSVRVAIENPDSAIDNARPLAVMTMKSGGLASSGQTRRGFRVGDQWFGHVLDPRTGWPVAGTLGVSVVAADTVTADVLATVVGVAGLDHPEVAALVDNTPAAVLVVGASGVIQQSPRWRELIDFDLLT